MPTSSYMPSVVVEIAFNAGFNTPAASRTYTDVSDYVELDRLITISVGRGDERSTADANQLTLTLDNRDGRFTPYKTGGAYYPNVKLDRPIRVTATPVDGGAQVEFLGFINEWPVDWDGTDATAYATISASSRLARLGSQAQLLSIVEATLLADAPVAYYTLGEPVGATQANDSSGSHADPLTLQGDPTLPVVFGNATGPGTDGLTAAEFVGGQYLSGSYTFNGSALTMEVFFLTSGIPSGSENLVSLPADLGALSIFIDTSGRLNATGILGPTGYTDGNLHHAALVYSISGGVSAGNLYVDGTSMGSFSGGTPVTFTGKQDLIVGGTTGGTNVGLTGVLAHLALTPTALSAARIAEHAAAGLTGFAGETTSARLARYAGYAGLESAAVSAETGQTTVQHVDTTGKQVVELMRLMETTEGGVLYDDRTGVTTFHNRAHRLTLSSSFTLDMAQHMVESGYQPKLDRSALANDVSAQDVTGAFTAHVFDATSKTDNGVATSSIETAAQDDDEPLFLASWALYKYKTPLPRVPTLAVDCTAQVGKTPNCSTVMAANVGSKFTVSNRPTQDSTSSGTFFVEGYTRVYGPEQVVTTFNVSPTSPDDQTYIVGDVTGRGVIGTNPIAL